MPTVDVGGLAVPFPHAEPYPEQLEYMVPRRCALRAARAALAAVGWC
jgi:hypothetical protein